MNWQTSVLLALFASQSLAATTGATCRTVYGSSSVKSVRTTTVNRTVTATYTDTTYVFNSSTLSLTSTVVKVTGKKTTTVPVGPKFTPLISAPTTSTTLPFKARVARTATSSKSTSQSTSSTSKQATTSKATTKFPQSVTCTTNITYTPTVTLTQYTSTSFILKTSTSSVATSTAYAACNTQSNVISQFRGTPVLQYYGGSEPPTPSNSCEDPGTGPVTCYDAVTCCEAAQRTKAQGFAFARNGFNICQLSDFGQSFTTNYSFIETYTLGNGPAGSGEYWLIYRNS